MRPPRAYEERWLGALGVFLAAGVYMWWEWTRRGTYAYSTSFYPFDDADEWRYTACSRLVEHGYTLFAQVFSAQPPLLFVSLAASMRLFGDSILGARLSEILFGLLAVAATAAVAWQLMGAVAAAGAALLLAVSPGFLVYSHTVEAEGPMAALVALSLAFAVRYHRTLRTWAAVAAGLTLAAAVLAKLFALEAAAPALWLLASAAGPQSARLRAAILFSLSAAVPVVAEFSLVAPAAQWDQVVRLHQAVASVPLPNLLSPWQILEDFVRLDPGLWATAATGVALALLCRQWRTSLFLMLWAGGQLVMLVLFRPLFPHHMAIATPALAVAAGAVFGLVPVLLDSSRWFLAPVVGACLIYLAALPHLARADRHMLYSAPRAATATLARWVDHHSQPGDMVAVDDLAVADAAHRLVPPPLCDPSTVRLRAGYLSAHTLIGATVRYRAAAVVPSSGIYAQVPGYQEWLRRHYRTASLPQAGTAFLRR